MAVSTFNYVSSPFSSALSDLPLISPWRSLQGRSEPSPSPAFSLNHTNFSFSCFIAGRFHLQFYSKKKRGLSLKPLGQFSRLYSSQRHQASQDRKSHGHRQCVAIHPDSVGAEFIRKLKHIQKFKLGRKKRATEKYAQYKVVSVDSVN